mgnify:CR=1 FL=1
MIGPVDSNCARALCQTHRVVRLSAAADEVRIFYNLSMDRVHYFPQRNAVYFVDSLHVSSQATIIRVLQGMGVAAQVEQLHLDRPGIFKGGKRVILTEKQAAAVLVALRLQGIQVAVSH